jgi:hypothetical protein
MDSTELTYSRVGNVVEGVLSISEAKQKIRKIVLSMKRDKMFKNEINKFLKGLRL